MLQAGDGARSDARSAFEILGRDARQRGADDMIAGQSHPVELVMAVGPGLEQDLVLGEEARRQRERDQAERADQEHPERERKQLEQAAHLEDVLFMMAGQDY